MATLQEKFANALILLKEIQDSGIVAIRHTDFPDDTSRRLLLKRGFLQEVSKGWYIAADPAEKPGTTTSWYMSYWDFCGRYLDDKFGDDWCLSADQSLLLHTGNRTVPSQLLVRSPLANNNRVGLPHGTSLFGFKSELPAPEFILVENGLRLYTLQASLIYSTPALYTRNAIDARTALSMIRDASELLPILIDNGHSAIAGRLAGAFRNMQQDRIADDIMETMKQIGYDVRENDPFQEQLGIKLSARDRSPYVNRIKLMWANMRQAIIDSFPKAPGLPENTAAYLETVEDIYVTDAYHSLSIERYKVTPELIARVSEGTWNLEENEDDRKQRDAMAARGYYQAFQSVKESITAILKGDNAGAQVDRDLQKWYRQLFDPSVAAGMINAADLAGYRNNQVYIGNSQHVPLRVDAMRDAMPVLFELLEDEPEASVRAVLGHFIFVFIHPYPDGNGRIGRFLMNAMLASGGYPWTVIPVERREDYMQALEQASVFQNIEPFAKFLGRLVEEGTKGKAAAQLPK